MKSHHFAVSAATAWIIAAVAYALLETQPDHRSILTKVFTLAVVVAGSLGIAVLVKLDRQLGGVGTMGWIGITLVGIGVGISAVTWGAVNVYLLIQGMGYLLYSITLMRNHTVPTASTVIVAGAFFTAPVAFLIANAAEIGTLNEYGDRDAAFAVGFCVGAAFMAIGLVGWARWLSQATQKPSKPSLASRSD